MGNKRERSRAPFVFSIQIYFQKLYLLDPACMLSLASPMCSTYFLPWKRASDSEALPSPFCLTTAESFGYGELRSTSFAGTLAITFLPCMMLTSTSGPVPSHCSL